MNKILLVLFIVCSFGYCMDTEENQNLTKSNQSQQTKEGHKKEPLSEEEYQKKLQQGKEAAKRTKRFLGIDNKKIKKEVKRSKKILLKKNFMSLSHLSSY